MYKFSKNSMNKLLTCDSRIFKLMSTALADAPFDFSIICGYRNAEEQTKCVENGTSSLGFPNSKHNKKPSLAVDLVPYPVDWDIGRFEILSWHILLIAHELKIPISWGGQWRKPDYPHWELITN